MYLQNTPKALHLFDYDKATPQALAQTIDTLLAQAHQQLDSLNLDNPTKPTDAKTALATIHDFGDKVYQLGRYFGVLSHLNSVLSSDDTRAIYETTLGNMTQFYTQMGQSSALYQLYDTVDKHFDSLDDKDQSFAQKHAITKALQAFKLSGVALNEQDKQTFGDIQNKLAKLSSQFSNNVLDATQSFAYPLTHDDLAGIKPTGLTILKNNAKNYLAKHPNATLPTGDTIDYVATLDLPSYLAVMQHAESRALRQKLYYAYNARASDVFGELFDTDKNFDNAPIISEILSLRAKKAKLLGFDNYSQVSLASKMADNANEVKDLLDTLAKVAKDYAKADLDELTKLGNRLGLDEIEPWDIPYLSEKLRGEKYALDSDALRAYFPLPVVLSGMFDICKTLFGIDMVQQPIKTWHKDVLFFEIFDQGKLLGGLYFDLYARTGKQGGAWLSGYQTRHQYHDTYLPVGFIVGNFTPPSDDLPALLSIDEVTTLFHEFGHGLHHLLSQVDVSEVAGIDSVEWDAVELPSQFLENFVYHAHSMAKISRHVRTNEPLPQDKLDAIINAKNFQSGLLTVRQLEFGLIDLLIHSQAVHGFEDVLMIAKRVRDEVAVIIPPDTNRFVNSFSHIFAGGYACGYYSYKWAEVLSADAFSQFEETGIFNSDTGRAFRQEILASAGSRPAKDSFRAFRGRDANTQALLRHLGFVS